MSLFGGDSDKHPWYGLGLAFECTQCGRCCSGPEEGYVWIEEDELAAIARFLGVAEDQVRRRHTRRVGRRMTIVEQDISKDCIFLVSDAGGRKTCRVYDVRPRQCRTWPFWPSNLSGPEAWVQAQLRCPGINRGTVHPLDEVQAKCRATDG